MNPKPQIKTTPTTPSRLERISIDFEYDKTFQQVRQDFHSRKLK